MCKTDVLPTQPYNIQPCPVQHGYSAFYLRPIIIVPILLIYMIHFGLNVLHMKEDPTERGRDHVSDHVLLYLKYSVITFGRITNNKWLPRSL